MNKRSFFIVGKHAVLEALKNPSRKVLRVFLTEESKKNIHRETIIIEGDIATEDTVSSTKNHTNVHFGFPIVFDQGTVLKQSSNTQFIVEPTLSRVFGETHLGFKVSFLFNN